jgi:hypothetical protein
MMLFGHCSWAGVKVGSWIRVSGHRWRAGHLAGGGEAQEGEALEEL